MGGATTYYHCAPTHPFENNMVALLRGVDWSLQREMEFKFRCGLVAVQGAVGGNEKFIQGLTVERIHGDTGADGKRRFFGFVAKAIGNALCHQECGFGVGFRKDQDKFVSSITGGDVNFARVKSKNISETAERATSDKVTMGVVDLFQMIEVEEYDRERRLRAAVSLDF